MDWYVALKNIDIFADIFLILSRTKISLMSLQQIRNVLVV